VIFLSYGLQAVPFFFAFLLGLLVPMLLIYLYRSFAVGVYLVAGSFLVDTWTLGNAAINLGINLFPADIALLLLGFSTVLRLIFEREGRSKNIAWMVFSLLVFVSLITGIISFGSSAGVQGRSYFYFVVSGTYAMSFSIKARSLSSLFNALIVITLALCCIAFYRWVVYYTPIPSLLPPGGSYNIDGAIRVIYSNHVLVIAQLMVSTFLFAAFTPAFAMIRIISPLLLGMVVVLQHRSVWMAAIVGIFVGMLLGKNRGRSLLRQVLLIAAIVAVTGVPLVFDDSLSGVTQQVSTSAAGAISGGGTGGERLQSWGEIVKNWYNAGARSIAIGQSFGSDNTRTVFNDRGQSKQISYIAHNLYVQTLFNTGLLGLLAYVVVSFYVLSGLYKICRTARDNYHAEILLVMISMQVVYYIPYGVDYIQALIFGAALSFVKSSEI